MMSGSPGFLASVGANQQNVHVLELALQFFRKFNAAETARQTNIADHQIGNMIALTTPAKGLLPRIRQQDRASPADDRLFHAGANHRVAFDYQHCSG